MSTKPEFYKTFMTEGFFPDSNKITRFDESENYWIFKTGNKIYKVKKKDEVQSTISLDEVFCNEIVRQIQQNSPDLEAVIITIKKENNIFVVDWNGMVASKPLYYMIAMNQLTDRGFLSNIITNGKLNERILNAIASKLVHCHQNAKISQSKDDGSPESLNQKLENLFYQSKKYLGVTITKAMIDMTLRPIQRYLNENRKLFNRRIKQEYIRFIHGCFIPRKIHISKDNVNVLGKTSDPLRDRFNDVVSDIADLTVELDLNKQNAMSKYFVDQYIQLSNDSEVSQVLPVHQALKCLKLGLNHSIKMPELSKTDAEKAKQLAIKYYEQTIEVVRGL